MPSFSLIMLIIASPPMKAARLTRCFLTAPCPPLSSPAFTRSPLVVTTAPTILLGAIALRGRQPSSATTQRQGLKRPAPLPKLTPPFVRFARPRQQVLCLIITDNHA